MKIKIILGVILLIVIGSGTYIYQNRYSFYRYLPNENIDKLQTINFKLCDEEGKLFTGRTKEESDNYTDIYSYKDGELDGLNVIYYKNQIKEIGHWKEGKQNGLFQLYTEEGILVDNANFKDGERDGLTEQYYSDTGKLRVIGNYKNSLQDGEWKFYLEKGNLQSVINYKDGELHGIKEDYYENGNLWTRQEFKNNIQEGVYEVYYEDGTPQLKARIKDGDIVEEQRFNRDGTLYEEQDDRVIVSEPVAENSDEDITITEIFE